MVADNDEDMDQYQNNDDEDTFLEGPYVPKKQKNKIVIGDLYNEEPEDNPEENPEDNPYQTEEVNPFEVQFGE